MPADIPYDTTLAKDAYALAARWQDSRSEDVAKLGFASSDLKTFNSNQKGEVDS